jgi:hypothetical protein
MGYVRIIDNQLSLPFPRLIHEYLLSRCSYSVVPLWWQKFISNGLLADSSKAYQEKFGAYSYFLFMEN